MKFLNFLFFLVVYFNDFYIFSPLEKVHNKLADVIDGACGEIRVAAHNLKTDKLCNDCNHIFICIDNTSYSSTVGWPKTIKDVLLQHEKMFKKLRITEVEVVYQSNVCFSFFSCW